MNRNVLILAAMVCSQLAIAQNIEKPNFALFIADDCSYYDLGCYGSSDSITPNIDNFAEEGMMFSKAYQAVPMSSSTRHNLYTGIWPVRSGAYPNHTFADIAGGEPVEKMDGESFKDVLFGKSKTHKKYSKKIKEQSEALVLWMEYCGDKGQETELMAKEHQFKVQKEKAKKQVKQGEEIFFADPTVFVQDGTYYLTGTRNAEPLGFQLLKSDDLRFWKEAGADTLGLVLRKDHTAFGEKGFWAPQILKHNGRYLMTYTASEQTALARSESIGGPYTQEIIEPIDGSEKNIDSFLFKDEDGKYYLYHVRFYNGNYIWVAEFDIDKGKIKPETLKKCFDCTEEWERTSNYKSEPIMEGPTVIKKDGFYYLFYSANHFKNIDYAVGYATAPTPFGPWTKSQNSPIIHRSIVGENGSGHGDLFQDKEGNYWYVFHVHNSDTEIDPRRTRIILLKFTLNEKTGIYDITADANSIIIPLKND